MGLREINLGTLGELNGGKVEAGFNLLLRKSIADCIDRSGCKGARVVTTKVKVIPLLDDQGDCYDVQIEVELGSKVPNYQSAPVICKAKKTGHALFNDLSEDCPDQTTIDQYTEPQNDD